MLILYCLIVLVLKDPHFNPVPIVRIGLSLSHHPAYGVAIVRTPHCLLRFRVSTCTPRIFGTLDRERTHI